MVFKYVIERKCLGTMYQTKYLLIFFSFMFRLACLNKGEKFNLKQFTIFKPHLEDFKIGTILE